MSRCRELLRWQLRRPNGGRKGSSRSYRNSIKNRVIRLRLIRQRIIIYKHSLAFIFNQGRNKRLRCRRALSLIGERFTDFNTTRDPFSIFSNGYRSSPFFTGNSNAFILGLRRITRRTNERGRVVSKTMRLELFNHNLNFRNSRHRRALLKSMRITTTKGTNLMKAFVNKRYDQIPVGSRDFQSTW